MHHDVEGLSLVKGVQMKLTVTIGGSLRTHGDELKVKRPSECSRWTP